MNRRRPRFEARQAERQERMRDTRLDPDPLHRLSPRVLVIVGAIFTVLAGGFVFSAIDGIWIGAMVFGVLAVATGAAVAGLKATGKLTDAREKARWIEVEEELVRTEKVEQLGHTMGGVSMAQGAHKQGALSGSDS
jgi:hypothetical protein